jgi:hypothetical protein
VIQRICLAVFVLVLTGYTSEQQPSFNRGLVWENNRYNLLPVVYPSVSALPPAKSLKQFYPRVVIESRQDVMGVAWGAIWNARTAAEAIACNQTNPADILKFAFAPAYNYALVRKGSDCTEAVSLIDLLESMAKHGTPYFSEFREFCAASVSPDFYPVAKAKKLSGYYKLYNTSDTPELKVQAIKQALNNRHAVLAGIICPSSFQLAQDFWQPREEADPQQGGHAVCVVGYDDTKFGGAFEVVNSWGKSWGKEGFTWIRYKDFASFAPYAFSLFQVGSAACSSPLEGSVKFYLANGQELQVRSDIVAGEYRIAKPLATGTELTVVANINRPAFFYSYFVDPNDATFTAFPMNTNTQPILFDRVQIPEGVDKIRLEEPAGLNQLYFIFSPEKIDAQPLTGSHRGNAMAVNAGVTWYTDAAGFSSTMKTPVVLKVFLEQK